LTDDKMIRLGGGAVVFSEAKVLEALKKVVDPELGLNIVDLGLIYDVKIEGGKVLVIMTLTTPGCPLHGSLIQGALRALRSLDGVEEAEVELVWEPPWSPAMISPEGRRQLEGKLRE